MAGKSKPDGSWQVHAEFSARRYRRVSTRLWDDARVRRLTPHGKLVWAFLLSAPSTTSIPGLFRLPEEEGARLCGLPLEGFREGFQEAFREGLVEADWGVGVVWIRKAPRHEWPTGPNVVKGWRTVCASLPECPLIGRALLQIRQELQGVFVNPEPFLKAFDEGFPEGFIKGFLDGLPKPLTTQKQDAEAVATSEAEGVSFPAAGAARTGQPALFAVPPARPPAKPPKPPKASAEPKGDPRHAPLVDALVAADTEIHGRPYGFRGGRDGKAVSECLALADQDPATSGGNAPNEVLRRWRIARRWQGFPACNSLTDLAANWNAYVRERASTGATDTRAQEVWAGLQKLRRQACEERGLDCPPEDASPSYLERALAVWAQYPKGDAHFDALTAAWVQYEAEEKWHAQGLPVRLFLTPGVFAVCMEKARAAEPDLLVPGGLATTGTDA